MFKIKVVRRAFDVVIIEMCERDNFIASLSSGLKIFVEQCWEVATLIILIVGVAHIGEIEENLATVMQVDSAAVGIADREERYFVHSRELLSSRVSSSHFSTGRLESVPALDIERQSL